MRIGIDFGSTRIDGALLDERGLIMKRLRAATPRGDYDRCVRTVRELVVALEHDMPHAASVGIAFPGSLDPRSGLVRAASAGWLNGHPLRQDLTLALARPVRIANDAHCFALSEALDGSGAGLPVVFGAILGAGCRGGIVAHGHVLTGPNAIAGNWGHQPLPWPELLEAAAAPRCGVCGSVGCIESWISGPAMALDFERTTGRSLEAIEIAAMAAEGDPEAIAALQRHETRVARALAHIVNLLDPDAIVLGGGMSNLENLYTNVPRLMGQFIHSEEPQTVLRRTVHGPLSGLRGAAFLWPAEPEGEAGSRTGPFTGSGTGSGTGFGTGSDLADHPDRS